MPVTDRKEKLLEMLKINPLDSFLRFALAKEEEKSENWAKALEIYQSIVDSEPNYTGCYYHYAKLLFEQGQTLKATNIIQTGIEICKTAKDNHALNELKGLLDEWE